MSEEIDFARLLTCVDRSRYVMQFFREEKTRAVKHLAGHRYSQQGAQKKTYVNAISLYCNIVGRALFSQAPRMSLSTFDMGDKPVVAAMEGWGNKEIERIGFAQSEKRTVMDALFAIGIDKVALATPCQAANVGWGLKAGEPTISRISLDDFVFDHHAKDFTEVSYIGHRYRVPLAAVADDKNYNRKAREALTASYHQPWNRQGDEKIGMIGRGYYGLDEEFEDMVDLWEIYLPRHRAILTFAEDDLTGPSGVWEGGHPQPLKEQTWLGPDTGPYHILAYGWIPDNPFPKGPVQDLVELHEALNESYRKLVRQAAREKKLTVHQRDQAEDAARIQSANDGDIVGLLNPQGVADITMGGVSQGQYLFMKEMFDRFSLVAGNLVTMGGLAPQAHTLGQEELLAQQSNGQVANMQDATLNHVSSVMRAMLWYWWHDPVKVMRTKFDSIPGVDQVQKIYPYNHPDRSKMRRSGEMPKIKVDPYSMRYITPQERANDLTSIVTQLYAPMAQLFAQQGINLDMNQLLTILAKYKDNPDVKSILTYAEPVQQDGGPSGGAGGGSPTETTRNYVRRSLGGNGQQNQDAKMTTAAQSNGWAGSLQKG